MSVADILRGVGEGVKTGAKALGAVAQPIAQRTAEVVSGEALQVDAEKRRKQEALEDAEINSKAQVLESQLAMGQKYGTLTPDQQQQYVDQITGLYSHPRHAGTLMEKLRKSIHPNGAYAQGPSAPLPNATPSGGTAQADRQGQLTSLGEADDLKKQQALSSIDWFKKNMLPQFPPEQQAQKLNQYIDHINGITQGAEKPPKGMKAMEQAGTFFGIEDQDTGKQYLKAQLEPRGDAPPEAKQMYAAVQKAAADKQSAADKKSRESEERQMRGFAHGFELQNRAIAISLGNYKEARREISKADESYQASVDRASTMDKAALAAKKGDQQAMFAILSNHIAMTLQQPQVSARPTKAMFDEAAGSLPWMQSIAKKFDSDGYLVGITLSPDQVDKMVDLSHQKVDTQRDHIDRLKGEYADDLNPVTAGGRPVRRTGRARVGDLLSTTGAKTIAPKVLKFNPVTGRLE